MNNDFIYDIESYPNAFTFFAYHVATQQYYFFEISERRNDITQLIEFINWCKNTPGTRWVGFNNVNYDYPVIHWIFENAHAGINAVDIYSKSMSIITADRDESFRNQIWDDQQHVPQVDLYLIHHFNNKARATSLKMLEFNMRSDNVEDLPFPVGTHLTPEQIDILLRYNKHDVDQTYEFYKHSLKQIEFREELNQRYGVNWTNKNDTAIGKSYFIKELEEHTPGLCYRQTLQGKKPNQTHRPTIALSDAVFGYIEFQRPEFQTVLEWLKAQTITETKGVFNDITEEQLGPLAAYAEMKTKRKRYTSQPHNSTVWYDYNKKGECFRNHREAKALNTVVNGFQFVFGVGGIHGSVESQSVYSDSDWVVMDFDVASYYPNLAIANKLYPEHLGEAFTTIYKTLYEMRKNTKKGTSENAMLKLALNGVYGDTNNKYSPFYDPLYTMRVTINGQLLLCLLAEVLLDIPYLSMIQINTDGLTVRYQRRFEARVKAATNYWQNLTLLDLEAVEYKSMHVRDVNNYLAVTTEGKIKRKGAYSYGEDLDWNQNHSAQIIAKAAEVALVYGYDIEEAIRASDDFHDFMSCTKIPRTSRLVLERPGLTPATLQNITRYYVSTEGGQLIKIMPPLPGKEDERRIGVNVGQFVKPCNDIKLSSWADLNYNWYVNETKKLVEPLL
jgi:hypothetical protein